MLDAGKRTRPWLVISVRETFVEIYIFYADKCIVVVVVVPFLRLPPHIFYVRA